MSLYLFETSIGVCGVAWSGAGLTHIQLPERDDEATLAQLRLRSGLSGEPSSAASLPGWVKEAIARIREHVAGRPQDLARIPIDLTASSPFHVAVLRALQRVPAGRTTTYGALAESVGKPGAARAVGRVMAQNPLPVVIPCHRVVARGGNGGFSAYGGVVTKARLLELEGGTLAAGQLSLGGLFGGSASLPFDADEAVRHLSAVDAVLGKHIERVGPLRLKLKATEGVFAALVESITHQQLSTKAAATIFARVQGLFPRGNVDPRRLLARGDAELRAAGLSASKVASMRDLAARTVSGELPSLPSLATMTDDEIVERLTVVRGVGRWTVEMLLIFRLGRPDVLPVADYGIRKGYARVFRRRGEDVAAPEVITRRAERWRPYRSVASWYLWRALDALPDP